MLTGPLVDPSFKPRFSGHETFPVRYGWLKKAIDAVSAKDPDERRRAFEPDEGIARYGVGRNMVASMRHWALATGVAVVGGEGEIVPSPVGRLLLGQRGLDPYLEQPASLWLLHWNLASVPGHATTWYWAFNHHAAGSFDKDWLVADLLSLCRERQWTRVAANTLRRDVDCFVRTYVVARDRNGLLRDDSLECPLAELELIVPGSERGTFLFRRGAKSSLPDGVFAYALARFWSQNVVQETLSMERIAYDAGSPGRVFKLDENSLAERLHSLETTTGGVFRLIEGGGLRQVQRFGETRPLDYLKSAFENHARLVA
jgi:hypothetical protein